MRAAAQVLNNKRPIGQLREGETVLVDDGTCPKGADQTGWLEGGKRNL